MKAKSSAPQRIGRTAESPARRYFKEVRFRQIRSLVELSRQGSFVKNAKKEDTRRKKAGKGQGEKSRENKKGSGCPGSGGGIGGVGGQGVFSEPIGFTG